MDLTDSLSEFSPHKAYSVSTHDLSRSFASTRLDKQSISSEAGITKAAFASEQDGTDGCFVIGCFGGSVLLCSHSTAADQESPVQMAFTPHRTTIACLQFSGKQRHLLLSASIDGEIRVYNVLDSRPLAVMHHEELGDRGTCVWSREASALYCLTSGTIRSIILSSSSHDRVSLRYSQQEPLPALDPEDEVSNLWLNDRESGCEQLTLLSARGDLCVWRRVL